MTILENFVEEHKKMKNLLIFPPIDLKTKKKEEVVGVWKISEICILSVNQNQIIFKNKIFFIEIFLKSEGLGKT